MRAVSYNCQAATWRQRIGAILVTLHFAQFIGLQGTNILAKPLSDHNDTFWTERVQGYDVVHWYAASTEYSNKPTGVSVAIDAKNFIHDIVQKFSRLLHAYRVVVELSGTRS